MYQTYIFDLYGTLIDISTDEEDPKLWETLAFHFRYSGMEVTGTSLRSLVAKEIEVQMEIARQYCEYPDFVMQDVLKVVTLDLGKEPTTEWLDETVKWFRILSLRHLALYDGVEEVIHGLKAQGKGIYLLSNGQKTFIEAELRTLGIYDLFDGIAISSEAGISKPDPLFYQYLENEYQADLSSAIMVGNDPRTDVEGAQKMGIDACYIHSNSSPEGFSVESLYQIWDGDFRKVPGWK